MSPRVRESTQPQVPREAAHSSPRESQGKYGQIASVIRLLLTIVVFNSGRSLLVFHLERIFRLHFLKLSRMRRLMALDGPKRVLCQVHKGTEGPASSSSAWTRGQTHRPYAGKNLALGRDLLHSLPVARAGIPGPPPRSAATGLDADGCSRGGRPLPVACELDLLP